MSQGSAAPLRLAGLLLAAGRSRRMGGALKQTLPWPPAARSENLQSEISDLKSRAASSTVVASAFNAIAPYCNAMSVVVGAHADDVLAALGARSFARVDADSDAPMFDSIRAGLRAIVESSRGERFDAVLLQPGDHPGVARSTVRALIAAHRADPAPAMMPEHAGKGGHPALIPMAVIDSILDWGADSGGSGGEGGGLRQFWIDHPQMRKRLAVNDPLCTLDLDTPVDYQAAFSLSKQLIHDL